MMPTAGKKEERLEARVSPETKALVQEAAMLQGRSLSDFVVQSAVEAANRAILERELINLSRRDREAFVNALLNPPEPSKRLLRAAKRHQEAFGR
jgi:uncharacterized protein (DUF1778 family)